MPVCISRRPLSRRDLCPPRIVRLTSTALHISLARTWDRRASEVSDDMGPIAPAMSQDEPAAAHLRLAQARARGGDHSGAIVAYRDALLLKPDLTDALIGLCDLHLIHGDWA